MKKRKLPQLIRCDRIVLKRHDLKIAKTMFNEIDRDRDRLSRFLPWVVFTKTVRDSQKYIRHTIKQWEACDLFDYGMYLQETGEFLGNIGVHTISWQHLHCEIGYWMIGSHEGHGYVTEAVTHLSRECFKAGFARIEIRCSSTNKKSAGVPKRCGFRLEGKLRSHQIDKNLRRDTLIFGLLKTDRKIRKS